MTEFVIENNEYTFSKSKILPRLYTLCLDTNIEVRKVALICIYKILRTLESEMVLNTLDKLKAMGTDREIN